MPTVQSDSADDVSMVMYNCVMKNQPSLTAGIVYITGEKKLPYLAVFR